MYTHTCTHRHTHTHILSESLAFLAEPQVWLALPLFTPFSHARVLMANQVPRVSKERLDRKVMLVPLVLRDPLEPLGLRWVKLSSPRIVSERQGCWVQGRGPGRLDRQRMARSCYGKGFSLSWVWWMRYLGGGLGGPAQSTDCISTDHIQPGQSSWSFRESGERQEGLPGRGDLGLAP